MKETLQCSLIINAYNQAAQLKQVLQSAARQTDQRFEIIIADDGSSDSTEQVIQSFREKHSGIPFQYVSHADEGFRRTVILNRAAEKANSEYLIFVDGDMILHPLFIENHIRYKDPKKARCGYRGVKLGSAYTRRLLEEKEEFSPSFFNLLTKRFRGELTNPFRGVVIHSHWIRNLFIKKKTNLPGCHFTMYRSVYEQANGMDESILEYGYEDFELGHRLTLNGIEITNVRNCCITYHLYHNQTVLPGVKQIKQRILENKSPVCRIGMQTFEQGSTNEDFKTNK